MTSAVDGPIPISLFVDDGAPIDPLFYEVPGYETDWLVPREFTQRFVEVCERFEVRGKFTVIPMPSCLGRIDQSLRRVPPPHLEAFLKMVRERIAPRFDITPEFLTHHRAYDLDTGRFQHKFEDLWLSSASADETTRYFELAFRILDQVGLPATGITSPWNAGRDVRAKYRLALSNAHSRVYGSEFCWYFLDVSEWEQPLRCTVAADAGLVGPRVVSVPANTADIFWSMNLGTREERIDYIQSGIERLLSADGRSGRLRELWNDGYPLVILTHWQSLYTQGTGLGLDGLCALLERIFRVFGGSVQWMTASELARRCDPTH